MGGGNSGAAIGDGGIGAAGGEAAGELGEAAFVVEGVGAGDSLKLAAEDIEGLGVAIECAADVAVKGFGGVAGEEGFEVFDAGVDGSV